MNNADTNEKRRHFNDKILLSNLSGDKEEFADICKGSEEQIRSDYTRLTEAFADGNIKKIVSLSHKIKGTCMAISCPVLGGLLGEIENAPETFEDSRKRTAIEVEMETVFSYMHELTGDFQK